jgi:alpha-glucosidase (family GH31 glycosyl hydrolase)
MYIYDSNSNLITNQSTGAALQYGSYHVADITSWEVLGQTTIVKRDPALYHFEDEAQITGESVKFTCSTSGAETMTVYVTFRSPWVFSTWMTVPGTPCDTKESFASSADEHFFGLGENWDCQSLDLKGLSVTMNNGSGTPDQGGWVPFYISTRGYGILIDNYLKVNFNFTGPDSVVISAPKISGSTDDAGYFYGSSLLWYFYYGPDLLDVIDRYTEHVSRPALPPPWALFATWQWRDTGDQAKVYADAYGMRDANIPCGLIWVDRPWARGPDNMPPPFEWQVGRYDNGSQMCADIQALGYQVGVWVAENLYAGEYDCSRIMDEPVVQTLKNDASSFIARDNIKIYKIDRGNLQCHAPYFTTQAFFETWNELFEGDFVTLPRTVAFRAQKYVSGKWPGDCDNTYDYPSGLKANLSAFQNLGIAGFAFWGSDTGGFPDPPGNNVTVRWAQFSCFCPIFETAGTPYAYPEHYRNIYRKYAELYTQLFPYRWTYARIAHERGHPIARALVLQYPDDPNTYGQDYEFLYGDWILAAPVVDAGTSRDVYLPQGQWIDFWHGTQYTGPRTIASYPAPEDTIPLFVKAGAIIPMIDAQQTWHNCTVEPMTLVIYPSGTSSFHVYGDNIVYPNRTGPYTNLQDNTYECKVDANSIEIKIGHSNLAYELHVQYDMLPSSLIVDSRPLPKFDYKADYDAANEGWYYGGGCFPGGSVRTVNIKIPKSATAHLIRFSGTPDRPVQNLTKGKRYGYIQQAIDDAANHDEIVVEARAYQHRENISFNGRNLTVRSTNPDDPDVVAATVINGRKFRPTVTFTGGERSACRLSGLTIADGNTGILCLGAGPTVTNCRVVGNQDCGIESWPRPGWRFPPSFINCTIAGNGGVGLLARGRYTPIIANCLVVANKATGIDADERAKIINCTIAANGLYGLCCWNSTVTNCVVWENAAGQIVADGFANYITYNNVQNGWPGQGNIDADPSFVLTGYWAHAGDPNIPLEPNDPNAVWIDGDYRLLPGSPCIDAGDSTALPADIGDLDRDGNTTEPIPQDLQRNPRLIDGDNDSNTVVDMGAYEAWPPINCPMHFTPKAVNLRSRGRWIKAHLVLPEGYAIGDVDANRPAVVQPGGIESDYINVFVNDDGLVEIEAAFGRADFCTIATGPYPIEVRVVGSLTTGQQFYGTDTIKITNNYFKYLGTLASRWLEAGCAGPDWCTGLDLNHDSLVNLVDLALFDACCIEVIKTEQGL